VRTGAALPLSFVARAASSFEVCQYPPGFILGMRLIICFSLAHSLSAVKGCSQIKDGLQMIPSSITLLPANCLAVDRFTDLQARALHKESTHKMSGALSLH
jgi:hypothetical protein